MNYYTEEELKLIEQIENSPSYKLAEDDKDFLKLYETRGVRLELDYLKAELGMRRLGIEHTIAIFGSARILPQDVAKRRVDELIENNIHGIELKKAVIALNNSYYYEDARELGRIIGESGDGVEDNRVVLTTGGGPGIMEGANRGAWEVGAKSIGLNINLPHEQTKPLYTPELCFLFHYFAIRNSTSSREAKGMVSILVDLGTLDELFLDYLTLKQSPYQWKQIPVGFSWKTSGGITS